MRHAFGVTIATSLEASDISCTERFPHVCVVDLRRCVNNGPHPIEERVLRRLANFRIAYEQLPMSLYSCSSRNENTLMRTITDQQGNVLVLTDHPVPMARFCRELDIPFRSKEPYMMEAANDYVPVSIKSRPKPTAKFGTFGS